MSKIIDLIGQNFGRLTVVSKAEPTKGNRRARWNCVCVCGNVSIASGEALRNGRSSSCGCYAAEQSGKRIAAINTTHGMCGTPEYRAWNNMKDRCYNGNNKEFSSYGGRGIKVCDRWLDSFDAFYRDMGDRPVGTSIDRIDNDGNYESNNCRWATQVEQANNKSINRFICYQGVTKTLSQWARYFNIPMWKLSQRILRDNLSFEDAVINNDRRYKAETA